MTNKYTGGGSGGGGGVILKYYNRTEVVYTNFNQYLKKKLYVYISTS
jgi:hypothetical protein